MVLFTQDDIEYNKIITKDKNKFQALKRKLEVE